MMNSTKKLGYSGEDIASDYLLSKGYTILARNWRFKRLEVDIIASDHHKELVFIEVKTRQTTRYGDPESAVDLRKQAHMANAAHHYLELHDTDLPVRFDIITILKENNSFTVKHLESAFFPLIK